MNKHFSLHFFTDVEMVNKHAPMCTIDKHQKKQIKTKMRQHFVISRVNIILKNETRESMDKYVRKLSPHPLLKEL